MEIYFTYKKEFLRKRLFFWKSRMWQSDFGSCVNEYYDGVLELSIRW